MLGGKVTVTLSHFEIDESGFLRGDNRQGTRPDGTSFNYTENFLVTGSIFDGTEIEFFGHPTDRLTVYGGFSDINTKTLAAGLNSFVNSRGVPEYKGSFFGKYDFGKNGAGLYLKGGFQLLGSQWADNENSYQYGATHRIDVGAGYRWRRFTVDLQLNNITDEVNPTSMVASGSNTIGPPFLWYMTVTSRF